jgi:hypothetical protein
MALKRPHKPAGERRLIPPGGLDRLWELSEDRDRLTAAERAYLALALGELTMRRNEEIAREYGVRHHQTRRVAPRPEQLDP